MKRTPTIWVMAGGTGGHIVPGLAVAEALRGQGYNVRWLGNPDRMEGRLVPPAGFEMVATRFAGVRGKGLFQQIKAPFSLGASVLRLFFIMLKDRPAVVLGMGGYVSAPGGVAAWLARVPIVLHEQNAIAGMSNRWLARIARRVLTGFPDALPNGVWVGNPVRESMTRVESPDVRYAQRQGPLRLLIVGGSLGALALNEVVPDALGRMPESSRPTVMHQSGQVHIEALRQRYAQLGVKAQCVAFIDDMASAMAQADLMICRAGAMTVSEVAAAGVAALFVPFPFAVDDHQTANANYLVEQDAAVLRQQTELAVDWLARWIEVQDRKDLAAYAIRARQFAKNDAAIEIAQHCVDCMRRSS
ncbi:undecaprenyldiphospho-muramoylpentapeptide beta-N-acetylglucosaminyltransferase [Orrella marina]|uniref:UDP-N-acetylglucosamine--N-acetylmuramyl-(pentapeptide) pyrophosphoryl-undecaprenol N-acetylglucosamine transferase n=1 Tax=Orrella marina TaxID=2163011 RepID=A0A2R4XKF6_9BURK|nr:undecaprenyldiphospho-muramoylpentapeptide beta-N-acetylglucosaminyltransferase [Orrella marina]AWB34276.1 undecaprenyldiphospho-muramoylpentapeptide beta-N-acetylglucosaminyltransferase [Orrella marina]